MAVAGPPFGPSSGRWAARTSLGLFALLLAGSLAWSGGRAVRRLEAAVRHSGESALAERSRTFGAPYALAIEEIRRRIPEDGTYALVDADPYEQGSVLWVRYDLAPRKPVLLGFLHEIRTPRDLRRRLTREARWVIVASLQRPPVLYERHQFMDRLKKGTLP